MKLWKSPVFYFGILLVVAIAGLLAAPFVIDWNSYRADLETYGRKLTGRTVTIEGQISARLFPWPRLTAEGVHVANPPELETREFARAERIVVRMTLVGLFRGAIDVEGIEIEKPEIGLERRATGEGNWRFTPAADLLASDLLSRVSLDAITLRNGTVRLIDRRRGETIELNNVNASIAAPSIAGPWRMRSVSLYGDKALDISVTTGVWHQDEAFRFGISLASADGSGLVFGFDGSQAEGKVNGNLRVEPAATDDGKGDAEGQLRPLVFTSRVTADFDRINLDDIEIAPRDPEQGGALTTGSARLDLGRHITARAELSAAMLDLDELAGAGSRAVLREAGSLAVANGLVNLLPKDLSLSGSLRVTALKTGGETLDNVKLALEADRNAIRIGEFSAGLPGRSKALFKGVFFPGTASPELAGDLSMESNDLRQLTMWAWPDGKPALAALWTGSRGRLKMQTDISLTPSRLRLSRLDYQVDGEAGSAQLSVTTAGRGAVDLRVDGKRIDVDSFMPQGLSAMSGKGVSGLVAMALPHKDAPDLRLTLQAGELRLNGVDASDVAIDLASGANGLDLRTLEIGSVGGARLEATGLILDSGKGADGAVGLNVTAEDPGELLRLLGLVNGGKPPAWASGLGKTAIRGDLTVKPAAQGITMSFDLGGKAGDLTFSGTGDVSPALEISGNAAVTSTTSGRLMKLLGWSPAGTDAVPGRIEITGAGAPGEGYIAAIAVNAYGARFDYNGNLDPGTQQFGLDGKIALRATDASPLIAAMGLPVSTAEGAVIVLDSTVETSGGTLVLPDIMGRYGAGRIMGTLSLDGAQKISGHIETGDLVLQDVLTSVFLDWGRQEPGLDAGFASSLPMGLTGEFWLKPASLAIHQHFVARDAEIGISAKQGEIRLALFGSDSTGRKAQIEISSEGTSGSRKLNGKIHIPVDLENQLKLIGGGSIASGRGLIDLRFEADGRSPGGALAGLHGSGTYDLDDLILLGLSPESFTRSLADAKDSAGITAALDALRGGGDLPFGKVSGTITIVNGQVAFLPFRHATDDAAVEVRTVAELALAALDVNAIVNLKARPGLPAMSVSYAGPPAGLARNEDNVELAASLGFTLMQQGVDELERLQREQARLAREQERQRIEDEARLEAYYAQRDELILRKRELKIHAEMRVIEAERRRRQLADEREVNRGISQTELKQRVREIRLYRSLAKLARANPSREKSPVHQKKPTKPKQKSAAKKPAVKTTGPLILVQPEGAPVLISPDPSAPPSQ